MNRAMPAAIATVLASYAEGLAQGQRGRVLDATAFEGAALRVLGAAWKCETFGVEPSNAAVSASYGTTRVVRGEIDDVRLPERSMSAAIGVLPHLGAQLAQRAHTAFLRWFLAGVMPSGLVAVLGPASAFDQGLCTVLSRYLDPVAAYRVPLLGGAVIAIGVAIDAPETGRTPGGLAKAVRAGDLPPFEPAAAPWTKLPAASGADFLFGPKLLRYADLAALARAEGVWTVPAFDPVLHAPSPRTLRPLMPLRRGHIALLIAAGMFDCLVLRRDGRRIAIKGHTTRRPETEETDEYARTRDRFHTKVAVLDLETGEYRLLQGA